MFNFLFVKIGITAIITKFINKLLEKRQQKKKEKHFYYKKLLTMNFPEFIQKKSSKKCLVKNLLHNRKVTVYVCSIFSRVLCVFALNY